MHLFVKYILALFPWQASPLMESEHGRQSLFLSQSLDR